MLILILHDNYKMLSFATDQFTEIAGL